MAEKTTYIKLDRNILRWGWYGNGNVMRVFLHLLLTASTTDRIYVGVQLHRGECLITSQNMQDLLNLSRQQIRTAIATLKKTKEIATRKEGKNTVYTVLNYDYYQAGATTKITTYQPQDNHESATYKNDKNYNNIIYTLSTRARARDTQPQDPETGAEPQAEPPKAVHGSMYHNVRLTPDEYDTLCMLYGKEDTDGAIDILDGHIQKRGAAFRSACHAVDIREWCIAKYRRLQSELATADRRTFAPVLRQKSDTGGTDRLPFDINDFFERPQEGGK